MEPEKLNISSFPPKLTEEGGNWLLALGEGEQIELPHRLGMRIADLITAQQAVDEHLAGGPASELSERYRFANCNKTFLYLTGHMSEDRLRSPDESGHQEVTDLLRKIEPGEEEYFFVNIKEALEDMQRSPREFPFGLHILDSELDMIPSHSILVLATTGGRFICFEKKGPSPSSPFQIFDLDELARYYAKKTLRMVAISPRSLHSF